MNAKLFLARLSGLSLLAGLLLAAGACGPISPAPGAPASARPAKANLPALASAAAHQPGRQLSLEDLYIRANPLPYLGLSGQTLHADLARSMDLGPRQRGVLVGDVVAGSPAERAGLRGSAQTTEVDGLPARIGGDVIVSIDDQPVQRLDDLLSYLVRPTQVGQTVALQVLRAGKTMTLEVTLGARPASP
ncbi:MAG: PDZ domain-containing protein [Anaerolineales bacterium]|nr:PDZ domain-containing protein [Anaerolineales bacterium]